MGNALAPGANGRNEASAFVDQRNRIIFEESKREDVLDSLQVRRVRSLVCFRIICGFYV